MMRQYSELPPKGVMKEELIRLVTLQKYDLQILEIEDHLTHLTKDIKKAEVRLQKGREQTEDKENKLKKLKVDSQSIDADILSLEQQYKQNNYQLMTLKDEKSYDAMKLQLEEILSLKGIKESSGLELLTKIEEEEKTLAMYHEKIDAEAERIQGLKNDVEQQTSDRSEGKNEMVNKRKGYADKIAPGLLATYTRLLGMPDRKAIAEVDANSRACRGCYSTVTRENMENVKLMKTIVHCNSCGRIVYIPSLLGSGDND
jgi:predicted  nucleic acid-binding Zn-ribbon protein